MPSPSPLPLSPPHKARARGRAYGLLRQIYLDGLTEETVASLRAVPDLAAALPDLFQADEAAADHHHLFGFNVFPFESIFLDESGLLGGTVTDGVLQGYQAAGYTGWEAGESPDHIGHELGLLAFLCAAVGEAWEDHRPAAARRLGEYQAGFLERHLLRWLPPLVMAIRAQNHPFYTKVADLTLDLAADHWRQAAGTGETRFDLPAPPDILGDEQTDLKQIATYLLTPAYSGIYLSRDDLGRLAQEHRLPRGFGGRQQMLLNLLRSAVNYEALDRVLTDLGEVAGQWQVAYGQFSFAGPWQARTKGTVALIEKMAASLSQERLPDS